MVVGGMLMQPCNISIIKYSIVIVRLSVGIRR